MGESIAGLAKPGVLPMAKIKEEKGRKAALAKEEGAEALKWLYERGVKETCPACGHKAWTVGSRIARLVAEGEPYAQGLGYPAFVLACGNCAYLMLFSAIAMGLQEPGGDDA